MTDSYRSLFGERDIEPMRIGFEPELDLDYSDPQARRTAQVDRIIRFLRNPGAVRDLTGDLTYEPDGETRTLVDARRVRALDTLRRIAANPKLLRDNTGLASSTRLMDAARDQFAARAILQEAPALYGRDIENMRTRNPANMPPSDRRGIPIAGTDEREILDGGEREGQRTSEASPAQRTADTPASLRPRRMSSDMAFLADVIDQGGADVDEILSRPQQLELSRNVNRLSAIYDSVNDVAGFPIEIGDNELTYPDLENVRTEMVPGGVQPPQPGQPLTEGTIIAESRLGNYTPYEVASAMNFLEENISDPDDINRDEFYRAYQDTDLPNIYDEPDDIQRRYNTNYTEPEYNDINDDPGDMDSYPESERNRGALEDSKNFAGQETAGQIVKGEGVAKIKASDLLDKYGRYIPVQGSEKKYTPGFLRNVGDDIENQARIFLSQATQLGDKNVPELKTFADDMYSLKRKLTQGQDIPNTLLEAATKAEGLLPGIQSRAVRGKVEAALKELPNKEMVVDTKRAGVGGGPYLDFPEAQAAFPNAMGKLETMGRATFVPDGFEMDKFGSFEGDDGSVYDVKVSRSPNYSDMTQTDGLSSNFLKMMEEKPFAGQFGISFQTRKRGSGSDFDYGSSGIPEDVGNRILKFVQNEGLEGIPGGAILYNSPLGDEYDRTSKGEGSKRASAYQRGGGFGGSTSSGQFAYIDPDSGEGVPIQPTKGGYKASDGSPIQVRGGYYSSMLPGAENITADDIVRAVKKAPQALREVPGNIKAAPMSLAPGAMDLVPSREAIKAGYEKGAVEMGKQMGKDFVFGIPTGAAAAAVLSRQGMRRARLPVAIGAGALAAGEALDEVVKQETGKGIGERVVEATPDAVKTRLAKAKEVFNPLKGEFGLSELITGR